MKESNLIAQLSFKFALEVVKLSTLLSNQKEFVLSKQLLRSASSIGANVEEASAAQSKRDFISKMSIASKEARETYYWPRLLKHSTIIKFDLDPLIEQIRSIINILTKIVKTAQQNLN